jgi:hypothetical protein
MQSKIVENSSVGKTVAFEGRAENSFMIEVEDDILIAGASPEENYVLKETKEPIKPRPKSPRDIDQRSLAQSANTKNLKTKAYTDRLLSLEHLDTSDHLYTYHMHYLCRAQPKLTNGQFKQYLCKPVAAIFRKLTPTSVDVTFKIDSTKINYESFKKHKLGCLIVAENKFRKQPTKPFWVKVLINESEYNGNSYYQTDIDTNISDVFAKKVKDIEEKYHLNYGIRSITDDEAEGL